MKRWKLARKAWSICGDCRWQNNLCVYLTHHCGISKCLRCRKLTTVGMVVTSNTCMAARIGLWGYWCHNFTGSHGHRTVGSLTRGVVYHCFLLSCVSLMFAVYSLMLVTELCMNNGWRWVVCQQCLVLSCVPLMISAVYHWFLLLNQWKKDRGIKKSSFRNPM
jgi:hypothetical protein